MHSFVILQLSVEYINVPFTIRALLLLLRRSEKVPIKLQSFSLAGFGMDGHQLSMMGQNQMEQIAANMQQGLNQQNMVCTFKCIYMLPCKMELQNLEFTGIDFGDLAL